MEEDPNVPPTILVKVTHRKPVWNEDEFMEYWEDHSYEYKWVNDYELGELDVDCGESEGFKVYKKILEVYSIDDVEKISAACRAALSSSTETLAMRLYRENIRHEIEHLQFDFIYNRLALLQPIEFRIIWEELDRGYKECSDDSLRHEISDLMMEMVYQCRIPKGMRDEVEKVFGINAKRTIKAALDPWKKE